MIPTISFGELVTKYGSINFGDWLDTRKNSSATTLRYEDRVMGFINGYNYARVWYSVKIKDLGGGYKQEDVWRYSNNITPSQVFYYLDKECAANPLKGTTVILYDFLRKKRG